MEMERIEDENDDEFEARGYCREERKINKKSVARHHARIIRLCIRLWGKNTKRRSTLQQPSGVESSQKNSIEYW